MCGIAGFQGDFSPRLLAEMNAILAHRGPDDSGTYYDPDHRVGLAHRRLSILDPSPRGRQPMWDAQGVAVITFNGEIYNFRELRERSIDAHTRFLSATDTEVLINLYLRYGSEMPSLLNGIFAFVIFDPRDSSLFVARDHLGVKPLYYAETERGFICASEIKALLMEPSTPREISAEAVRSYVTYMWSPAPGTMLEGVRKLSPGCALKVKGGRIVEQSQFYEIPVQARKAEISDRVAVELTERCLETAVTRQLISDAPVGAFLSGGVDSSAIAVYARRNQGSHELKYFGISTKDMEREGFPNDGDYARLMADHLGLDLTLLEADVSPSLLPRMIYHLDEPQADPAAVLVSAICREARKTGVKVLLSGLGADDLLGGYRRHLAAILDRYWSWTPGVLRAAARAIVRALPVKIPALRRMRKLLQYDELRGDEKLVSYFQWLDAESGDSLYGPAVRDKTSDARPVSAALMDSLTRIPADADVLDKLLFLELKHFVADHNLNYTDKMSMAEGVEVRVPFLDLDFVAFAMSLPTHQKIRGLTGKWTLRKAIAPHVPPSVISRKKTGFGVPLRSWFGAGMPDFLRETLSASVVKRRGLFDPAGVKKLRLMNAAGLVDASYSLLAIACIELWMRTFIDGPTPALIDTPSADKPRDQ